MALLPVATALAKVLEGITPPTPEMVALDDADGRVLADDIAARLTQPPFNASAMDGYAVFGDAPSEAGDRWTVIGESAAGHAFAEKVERGQAVRIFTGAPVPATCGTVVIQENVSRTGDVVTAIDATRPKAAP